MTTPVLPTFLLKHPFWKFSLKIYGSPEVEQALILLQNKHGLNINMVLYCCWYAFRDQGKLNKNDIIQLLQIIQYWHDKITIPIRRLRQQIKNKFISKKFQHIYSEILQHESFSEQVEQLLLADVLVYQTKPIRTSLQKIMDSCKSIMTYCEMLKINLQEGDVEILTELLSTIFNKIDRNDIVKNCKNVIISGASQMPLDL